MSNGFQEREEGFEAKLKHDQDVQFRVQARRDKLIGQWAAEQMGMEGDAIDDYAMTLVKHAVSEPGDDDVISKLVADLKGHGVDMDADAVSRKLAEFETTAASQLHDEGYDRD
jgi:hypothetical protein